MRHDFTACVAALLPLAGCNDKQAADIPKAHSLNAEAIGHYCGINVSSTRPKGQVILQSRIDPVWFSSARDTLAFTHAPRRA